MECSANFSTIRESTNRIINMIVVIQPIWPACVGWQSCHPCRRLPVRFLFWWLWWWCWPHRWLTLCCSWTTVLTSHSTGSSSSPIHRHTWPIGPPGPANLWTRMASWFTVWNFNCVVLCVIFFADYWPSAPLALCDYVLFSSFSTAACSAIPLLVLDT